MGLLSLEKSKKITENSETSLNPKNFIFWNPQNLIYNLMEVEIGDLFYNMNMLPQNSAGDPQFMSNNSLFQYPLPKYGEEKLAVEIVKQIILEKFVVPEV